MGEVYPARDIKLGRDVALKVLPTDLLVERYVEEMGAAVVDAVRLRSQFLVMIERLFPGAADAVGKRLRKRPRELG